MSRTAPKPLHPPRSLQRWACCCGLLALPGLSYAADAHPPASTAATVSHASPAQPLPAQAEPVPKVPQKAPVASTAKAATPTTTDAPASAPTHSATVQHPAPIKGPATPAVTPKAHPKPQPPQKTSHPVPTAPSAHPSASQVQRPVKTGKTPSRAILDLAAARHAFWTGDLPLAIHDYQLLLRYHANADIYGELGNVYYRQGNFPAAGKAYAQAAQWLLHHDQAFAAGTLLPLIQRLNPQAAMQLWHQAVSHSAGKHQP